MEKMKNIDKSEEISAHESDGDAFVTCLDGVGEITIDDKKYELHEGGLIQKRCCRTITISTAAFLSVSFLCI